MDSGQKFIPKEHSPPYSSDIFPLDYGVNGNLKRILTGRKCKDLDGLARVVKKVWDEYDIKKIRNVLSAWPTRVQMVTDNSGFQTEHLKEWSVVSLIFVE